MHLIFIISVPECIFPLFQRCNSCSVVVLRSVQLEQTPSPLPNHKCMQRRLGNHWRGSGGKGVLKVIHYNRSKHVFFFLILFFFLSRHRQHCLPSSCMFASLSLFPSLSLSLSLSLFVPSVCGYVSGLSVQKICIGNEGTIAQFSAHHNVPFSDWRTDHRMRVAYLRLCVWSGARVAHATSPPGPRQCPRPQHGQTTVGFKPARGRRSGAIDWLQGPQVGISYRGQCVCCELLMNVFVCVCVCVCMFNAQCVCVCVCVCSMLNIKMIKLTTNIYIMKKK